MMTEKNRKNVIGLERILVDQISLHRERRAVKALKLLCDAVSSSAAKPNGLSEQRIINAIKKLKNGDNQIINAIEKLKPLLDEPDFFQHYTPVWNISSKDKLEQVGLDQKEIESLASILPFEKSSNETDVSDQLIPEILFSLEILDYDEDKFRQFTSRMECYPAVGVLLCEILTDSKLLEKARQFLDRESTDLKREILLEYLEGELLNLDNLNIAHFASSCGQYITTIVPKEINCIKFWFIKVSESNATALATLISHSSVVKELQLFECGLNSKSLASLQDGLKNSDVKIRSLDISGNRDIDQEGCRFLGNIVKSHAVEELKMSGCGLSLVKLKSFDNASGNIQIRSLIISWNQDIDEEGFRYLGNIVKKHAVEELNMSNCGLSFRKLMSFDDASENAKIKVLDVSYNDDLNVNAICQLALKVTESLSAKRSRTGVFSEQDIRKLKELIRTHHFGGLKVNIGDGFPELQSGVSTPSIHHHYHHEYITNISDSTIRKILVKNTPSGSGQSENQKQREEEIEAQRDGWVKLSGNIFMYNKAPLLSGTQVYRAELRHASGKTKDVVVKLLPKDDKHKKEIDILLGLDDHPNIVKIIYSGEFPGLIPQLYVVMERCHQNLKQYIKGKISCQLFIPVPKAKSFFKQMISAIVFIHGHKIVHRDLKPSNILISSDEESLKVADFGISREIPEDRTQVTVTNSEAGTEGYKPPEAHQGARIGYKADVFQMGINGYYIFTTGQHPFGDDSNIQAVNIKNNNSPDFHEIHQLPGPLTSLLKGMLQHSPADRPTAKQVLSDDFFNPL